MKKNKSFRWKVSLLTNTGNFPRSGYSISRFDAAGFRLAGAYHCQNRADAVTVGQNFVNKQQPHDSHKAIIRLRWKAVKPSQVLYGDGVTIGKNQAHHIDPASPTGYSVI